MNANAWITRSAWTAILTAVGYFGWEWLICRTYVPEGQSLLVMYKGSMRSPATITRTKEEAKTRAEEALKKAKAGTKFEDLVKEYSDEPGAGQRGGDLGSFQKGQMAQPFQDGVEKT